MILLLPVLKCPYIANMLTLAAVFALTLLLPGADPAQNVTGFKGVRKKF